MSLQLRGLSNLLTITLDSASSAAVTMASCWPQAGATAGKAAAECDPWLELRADEVGVVPTVQVRPQESCRTRATHRASSCCEEGHAVGLMLYRGQLD